MTNKLIAYFSASGVTKNLAKNLSNAIDADIYEIKPKTPYTKEDLNWMDEKSRSSIEMKDKNYRPEIIEDDFSIDSYDTIFLGFPIWWYIAPTIINTFLERYDFSNKTLVLFATSGGSRMGRTVENIKTSVSNDTKIIEGGMLNTNPSIEDLKLWADSLKI